jgi:hypothetical protein
VLLSYEGKIPCVMADWNAGTAVGHGERPLCFRMYQHDRMIRVLCINPWWWRRQLLTDEDFNKLKEDLIWEGSKVAYLNRNETLFLSAMSTYLKGPSHHACRICLSHTSLEPLVGRTRNLRLRHFNCLVWKMYYVKRRSLPPPLVGLILGTHSRQRTQSSDRQA